MLAISQCIMHSTNLIKKSVLKTLKDYVCPRTLPYTIATTPLPHCIWKTQEGVTQGGVCYQYPHMTITLALSTEATNDDIKQVWFADDTVALQSDLWKVFEKWWDYLKAN